MGVNIQYKKCKCDKALDILKMSLEPIIMPLMGSATVCVESKDFGQCGYDSLTIASCGIVLPALRNLNGQGNVCKINVMQAIEDKIRKVLTSLRHIREYWGQQVQKHQMTQFTDQVLRDEILTRLLTAIGIDTAVLIPKKVAWRQQVFNMFIQMVNSNSLGTLDQVIQLVGESELTKEFSQWPSVYLAASGARDDIKDYAVKCFKSKCCGLYATELGANSNPKKDISSIPKDPNGEYIVKQLT